MKATSAVALALILAGAAALPNLEPYRISCTRGGNEVIEASRFYTDQLDLYIEKRKPHFDGDYGRREAAEEFAASIAGRAEVADLACQVRSLHDEFSFSKSH